MISSQKQPQAALSELIRTARLGGSKFILQLNYAGKNLRPADLQVQDLEKIISDFAASAEIIETAGADGVQIHGAHDYLIARCLSAQTNSRTDRWGQASNYAHFLNRIVEAIRSRVSSRFVLSVKLNTPFSDQNPLSAAECLFIALELEKRGVDLIEFSRGIKKKAVVEDGQKAVEFCAFVKQIKEKIKIPIIMTGGIRDIATLTDLIESDSTDLVGLGRPFICEPALVRQLQQDAHWQARCTSCTLCLVLLSQKGVDCAISTDLKPPEPANSYCFRPRWEPDPILNKAPDSRIYILWGGPVSLVEKLQARLTSPYNAVVRVQPGAAFSKQSDQSYLLDPCNPPDYRAILDQAPQINGQAPVIIYLEGCGQSAQVSLPGVEQALTRELYPLLYLSQALIPLAQTSAYRLLTVTTGAQQVDPNDQPDPCQAALIALTRVIPYEVKLIDAKALDLSLAESPTSWVEAISTEAASFQGKMEEIAYREGKRLVRQIAGQASVAPEAIRPVPIRSDGAYLIVGGLSGLGNVLAEYLVGKGARNLILIGRQELPAENTWEKWLAQHAEHDPLSKKIRTLQTLSRQGARIHYHAADVADLPAMSRVMETIQQEALAIRGVIHCAGALDTVNRSLQRKSIESFTQILSPKVQGTVILYELTRQMPLDFIVLCSSIAGLDGKLGVALSDYAVANAFQDAFANRLKGSVPLISIAWSLWKNIGLGARKAQGDFNWPLSKQEGWSAFEYILASQTRGSLAVLNPQSENFSLDFFNSLAPASIGRMVSAQPPAFTGRSSQVAGQGDELAEFIQDLLVKFLQLERESIRPHTPFADYGIDSVIVADMVGALEARLKIQLHPALILEYPTVARLSEYLRSQLSLPAGSEARLEGTEQDPAPRGRPVFHESLPDKTKTPSLSSGDEPPSALAAILDKLSAGLLSVEAAMNSYGEIQ